MYFILMSQFGLTIFQVQLSTRGQQLPYQMAQVNIFVKASPEQPQLCVQFSPTIEVWLFRGWFSEIPSLIGQAFNNLSGLFSLAYSLQQLFFPQQYTPSSSWSLTSTCPLSIQTKTQENLSTAFPNSFIAPPFLALCSIKPSSLHLLSASLSP